MITILIVDDEKLERRGIRFLLKREGDFQILEAANGKDALGILASNHVDILFSDVKMPYMNGLELTKAVREDNDRHNCKNKSSHHCSHIYGTISTFQILDCHRHCLIFSLIQYK